MKIFKPFTFMQFLLIVMIAYYSLCSNIKLETNKLGKFKDKFESLSFTTTEVPQPGTYRGKCLNDRQGPDYCLEDRLICTDKNGDLRCYIKPYERCYKVDDIDTTCSKLDFKCINYRVKDEEGKDISLCAPKNTYMDVCSASNPCTNGFTCTKTIIGDNFQNVCLVSKEMDCSIMKMCAKGYVCDPDKKKCIVCNEDKNPNFKTENGFINALKKGSTCDELNNGGS